MHNPLFRKLLFAFGLAVGLTLVGRYLLPIALPFLLAAALALAAEPLVGVFQRRMKLPRLAATGLGIAIAIFLLLLLLLVLGALLLRQLQRLAGIVPDLGSAAMEGLQSLEDQLLRLARRTPQSMQGMVVRSVEDIFSNGSAVLDRLLSWVLSLASKLLSRLPDSLLGLGTWVLSCFMISAKLPGIRRWLADRLPESWRSRWLPALKQLRRSVFGWVLAQCKLIGITCLVLCLGFLLLRIPYAPLWAVLISLVDALPILGTGTVLIPWSLIAFLQGDTVRAMGILGIFAVAALLRSVLEPRFVGKQLGLDPLVTLFAMYAGYRIWGIGGMLLSPLLAVSVIQLLSLRKIR